MVMIPLEAIYLGISRNPSPQTGANQFSSRNVHGFYMKMSYGPFTSCLKDVRPSTAMTVGWLFTGSAFTLEIRK